MKSSTKAVLPSCVTSDNARHLSSAGFGMDALRDK